ncbi:MAG: DUF4349 domain-containing protein [Oscillibacter sp.]|nr:DUF4349 domain-containing protein [Oscillibacter sp.]MEA4994791.1 DUF4349 domain-containing protein [Oscillibacter sp.]
MKRKLAMLLAALCLTVLAAGCGASSGSTSLGGGADGVAAPAERPTAESGAAMDMNGFAAYEENGKAESQLRAEKDGGDGSKLIYTAELNLETTTFDETVKNLSALVEELGGWTQSSSVSYGGSGYRYGSYAVRVPKEKFSTFLTRAGELAHVTYTSSNVEDVSEMYYDTAGRLETQKTKLARLQDLLAKAENMEDIITIESAISEAESQIEYLAGEMKHYDSQVDYSTVQFSLNEVYQLSNVEQPATGFFSRLAGALSSGARGFADAVQNVLLMLAYAWVWVALVALVLVGAVLVRRKRKTQPQKEAPAPETQDDKPE